MKSTKQVCISLLILFMIVSQNVRSTPSTIIWIPSTDFQPFKTIHLGVDNYFTVFKKGIGNGGAAYPTDLGLTVGVLPYTGFQLEVGVDLLEPSDNPILLNGKIGFPENAIASGFPALAVGIFGVGTKKDVTDYNIIYGMLSKNFPTVGRLSVGYYQGNVKLLMNPSGEKDNSGIMASWDRSMSEISDKLWFAVDYQSGKNSFGALSAGFSWAFTTDVGVIFGYDIFNNNAPGMFTIQMDINL